MVRADALVDPRADLERVDRRGGLRRARAADRQGASGRAAILRLRLRPPVARVARGADELRSLGRWVGRSAGSVDPGPGRDRAADRGAGSARKRGALPAHRRPGAGTDVGHPARPNARFRQRGLRRFRRRNARGRLQARLADPDTPRRHRSPRRGVDRRRGPARDLHAGGPLHARRRRVSLAEEQQLTALRTGRGTQRIHRRGDRHHRREGG